MPVYDLRRNTGQEANPVAAGLITAGRAMKDMQNQMFRMQQLRTDQEYLDIAKQKLENAERGRKRKLANEAISQYGLQALDQSSPDLVQWLEQDQGFTYPRSLETGEIEPTTARMAEVAALEEIEARTRKLEVQTERERLGITAGREELAAFRKTQKEKDLEREADRKSARFLIKQIGGSDPEFAKYLKQNMNADIGTAMKTYAWAELSRRTATQQVKSLPYLNEGQLRKIAYGEKPVQQSIGELAEIGYLNPELAVKLMQETGGYIPSPPPPEEGGPVRPPGGGMFTPLPEVELEGGMPTEDEIDAMLEERRRRRRR